MYAYTGMEPVTVPYASGRNVNGKVCKPLNREQEGDFNQANEQWS